METIIEGYKNYRHSTNPKEKELHDKFIKEKSKNLDMDLIVFGHDERVMPNDYLTHREKRIVISTIQWLGSPVGQGFLRDCGFKLDQE